MINYERIKETKIEDFIFVIYYIIITISLYSNVIERKYLIYHNKIDRDKYRNLLFIIYGIAFCVYLYYAYNSYQGISKSKTSSEKRLNELSTLASFLVLISGIIYLYIIYKDQEISIELAFN